MWQNKKFLTKEVLAIINVFGTPVIAFLGWNLINYLIPEVIFRNDNTFLEIVLRATYVSATISILSFIVLMVRKRDSLKSVLFYTLSPIIISAVLAPFLVPAIGMLIYVVYMYCASFAD